MSVSALNQELSKATVVIKPKVQQLGAVAALIRSTKPSSLAKKRRARLCRRFGAALAKYQAR